MKVTSALCRTTPIAQIHENNLEIFTQNTKFVFSLNSMFFKGNVHHVTDCNHNGSLFSLQKLIIKMRLHTSLWTWDELKMVSVSQARRFVLQTGKQAFQTGYGSLCRKQVKIVHLY